MKRPTPERWQDNPFQKVPRDPGAPTNRDAAILVVFVGAMLVIIGSCIVVGLRGCNADAQGGANDARRKAQVEGGRSDSVVRSVCGAAIPGACDSGVAREPLVGLPNSSVRTTSSPEQRAVAKCRVVWQRANPKTFDPDLCTHFVREHYAHGERMGSLWYVSLIYSWSGSSLKPTMVSRATLGGYHARGLCDVLWSTHRGNEAWCTGLLARRGLTWLEKPVLHDPYLSVRLHCVELLGCVDRDDWRSMRRVFLPATPDGARAMQEQRGWLRLDAKARGWIAQAYGEGLL